MKEEDLSRIKRYPIVEYLERKGIKPVRKTPTYAMYRSPLREETHPSFKVDTEKNLWIDYGEGRGGSIIDLCMRMEGCTLSEAIRHLGRNAPDDSAYSSRNDFASNYFQPSMVANGARRLISISDTLPPHLQEYLTKVRCIDLERAMPFLKCISYEVRGQHYQAIGFANQLAANQANQLLQIRGLLIAQQNAATARMQAQADLEARQQAAHATATESRIGKTAIPRNWLELIR